VGGSAALLAAGSAILAGQQDHRRRASSSQGGLDAALTRQRVFAASTWTLTGASMLGLGVYIAL